MLLLKTLLSVELPEPPLTTTLPGFMRLPHYLRELDAQVAQRRPEDERVALLLASVNQRRELAGQFQTVNAYVHGDCKINNLLYRGDRAVCILDLDTVMPGHWAWDFGDLVRSAAAVGDTFSLPLFAALAEGFVAASGHSPSMVELVRAPRYVGTMLAVRFLADHLAGDAYFRVDYPGENLVRAEEQMRLVEQMEAQESQMLDIVAALRP